jgi:hypothetical protein
MLNVKNLICGLATAIIASSAALATDADFEKFGFESKNAFPEGTGQESRSYGFILPEGITVTIPDGETYGPGDVIMVPGKNITVVDVDDETQDTQSTELEREAFNGKISVADPAQAEGKGVVAVSIHITTPGLVVTAADGRSATTGDTVVLRLLHNQIMQTPEQETPAEKMQMMRGFDKK